MQKHEVRALARRHAAHHSEDGRILRERLAWLSVDEEDILEAAHVQHDLLRLDQISYAIVERNGEVAIIPWKEGR